MGFLYPRRDLASARRDALERRTHPPADAAGATVDGITAAAARVRHDLSTQQLILEGLAVRIARTEALMMATESVRDVERLMSTKASELQQANPRLTREQAMDLALVQNPDLYERYNNATYREYHG